MSSRAVIFIDEQDKPTNLPDPETIVKQCFALGPQQATATNISGVRIDLDKTSPHDASTIWVKFGAGITMGEAKTQRYVSQYLQRHDDMSLVVRVPRVYLAFTWGCFGFIVGEFIDGQTCDPSDTPLIVAAVQALISIPSPGPKPGRVGGGLMEHPFFWNREASKEYESVAELQAHVNGVCFLSFCLLVSPRASRTSAALPMI